jgi:hypothetical protein
MFRRAGSVVASKVPLYVDRNGSFPTATYLVKTTRNKCV